MSGVRHIGVVEEFSIESLHFAKDARLNEFEEGALTRTCRKTSPPPRHTHPSCPHPLSYTNMANPGIHQHPGPSNLKK